MLIKYHLLTILVFENVKGVKFLFCNFVVDNTLV